MLSGEPGREIEVQAQEIKREDILLLPDKDFNFRHVCIVTGAASGFGRAVSVAAAANNLMTIGLDVNLEMGETTQHMAREMGGQMIFIETDIAHDQEVAYAVSEASKLGTIKYLVNIVHVREVKSLETLEIENYDFSQRIILQAPLCLSKLVIPHMRKSGDGSGVIGNITVTAPLISRFRNPVYRIARMALAALSQSIEAEGDGKIRSFCLDTGFPEATSSATDYSSKRKSEAGTAEKGSSGAIGETEQTEKLISPVDLANLVIFGFSRFARNLKDAGYPFSYAYGG